MQSPAAQLDITRDICPMTYVRVKLAMEKLERGAVLEVRLKGDEPTRNVPRSLKEDGHEVLSLEPLGDGTFRLLIAVH